MSDIIKLLPDSVANQIAAGEVVQRPASVVKELLENSLDAGSTDVKLIVKDAGRTLIQVTDNGEGMSETDARMSFERHATSKINDAKDLFALTTMGFRGEALASIASVARVEMKTRDKNNTLGTELIVEGSKTVSQEPCQAPEGTTIAVKNLFFNTPARRNFLKSDQVERNHINTEFQRVALANPNVAFSFYHNNQLVSKVEAGNLKQRIVSIFGNNYNNRLVPVEEETQIVKIKGFVVKPEFAKKRRGDQFFFVNNRFVKSPYLNHAVEFAFYELIPNDQYPAFFIFLDLDPGQIDVNVHPTKTEIKFQDEKSLYQLIKVSVKRGLGKFNIVPSLDFDRETGFDDFVFDKNKPVKIPGIEVNPDYNPFEKDSGASKSGFSGGKNLKQRVNPAQWEKIFPEKNLDISDNWHQKKQDDDSGNVFSGKKVISSSMGTTETGTRGKKFLQVQGKYILTPIKSGIMLIDQQRAHERILFEKQMKRLENQKKSSQTLLYPEQIRLPDVDYKLLTEIREQINQLGFDIQEKGNKVFMVNAVPPELPENENFQQIIESMIDQFKRNSADLKLDPLVNLARALARSMSLKYGKVMHEEEMNAITDDLFSCEMPYHTPSGKTIIVVVSIDEIGDRFK